MYYEVCILISVIWLLDRSCPTISIRGPLTSVHTPFGLTLPEIDQKCRTEHAGCVVEFGLTGRDAVNRTGKTARDAGQVVDFGLTVRDAVLRTGITARDAGQMVALGNQTTHIPHDMHRLTHRSLHLSSILRHRRTQLQR
jgi:hypothetical protein